MDDYSQDNSLSTRVSILERDSAHMSEFFDRLDSAIAKMTDMSTSIKEMLIMHELRLTQQETKAQDFVTQLDKQRQYNDAAKDAIFDKVQTKLTDQKIDLIADLKELEKELNIAMDKVDKLETSVDRYRWFFMAIGTGFLFILYKLGIIPFVNVPGL